MENTNQFFRTLNILHLAMMAGVGFFLAIVTFMHQSAQIEKIIEADEMLLVVIALVFAFAQFMLGTTLFNKRLQEIKMNDALEDKLSAYRSAFIIRMALLEGAGFLAVVLYMLSASYFLLGIGLALLFAMLLVRPVRSKVASDLHLSSKERQSL